MFESIVGNQQVKKYLARMIETKAINNSLLFAGPEGVGKGIFAYEFAKQLICADDPEGRHRQKIESGNHPDIRIYRPEGKIGMHSIASLRQLSEEVYLAPYESRWKLFIIHEADRMLTYSANALLKTFEEPSLTSILILISGAPASLLPTVASRCQTIYFRDLSEEERALLPQNQKTNVLVESLLTRLAQGRFDTYKALSEFAASLAGQIDQAKAEIEEESRKNLLHGMAMQDLTAVHKQNLEKEIEGAVSMHTANEAHALFDALLGWYRDMNLMLVNGNRQLLRHPQFADACEQALQRGEILSIEAVQKVVEEARLALERSTSLNLCMEGIFLRTGLAP